MQVWEMDTREIEIMKAVTFKAVKQRSNVLYKLKQISI